MHGIWILGEQFQKDFHSNWNWTGNSDRKICNWNSCWEPNMQIRSKVRKGNLSPFIYISRLASPCSSLKFFPSSWVVISLKNNRSQNSDPISMFTFLIFHRLLLYLLLIYCEIIVDYPNSHFLCFKASPPLFSCLRYSSPSALHSFVLWSCKSVWTFTAGENLINWCSKTTWLQLAVYLQEQYMNVVCYYFLERQQGSLSLT